ncbi:hypothetical protein SINU_14080, partial [Sporolactobacillus inulinus CASD]
RASETPQILACLRRLAVRPRQASNRSGDSALIRHESITQGCPVFLFLFAQKCPRAPPHLGKRVVMRKQDQICLGIFCGYFLGVRQKISKKGGFCLEEIHDNNP